MAALRGNVVAFAFFAVSFALHIIGGAADQDWLFALAVALIYLSATGFPAIAALVARERTAAVLVPGAVLGYAFTVGALWAANGRAFAWWEWPLAALLVAAGSAAILWLDGVRTGRRLAEA